MNLRIILVLSITHLCIDITGSALPAIMPFLKNALGLNYTAVGAAIMISNLTSSVIQPAFGRLSDKMEIKWLLPVSIVFTYGGFSLTGVSPSYSLLLLFVVVNGIGVAIYHPESFKIAHYFTGDSKATGMSLFQVGGNLGLALGPLLVTYAMEVADLQGTLLFVFPGLAILGVMVLFQRRLTFPLKHQTRKKSATPSTSISGQKDSRWVEIILLTLAVSARSWAHMGLITFAPFYYISVLNGDPIGGGRLVFAFLMGGALGTLVGGVTADRVGLKRFFSLSMLVSVPLLFLFLHVYGMWAFIVLFAIGFTLISSFSVTVVMGQTILKDSLGMASGLMLGFVIGIGGIGAGLLGLVADALGVLTVLKLIAIMPIIGLIPLFLLSYPAREGTADL